MGIIGTGDIASVLPKSNDLLFFASGVSNSQCEDETEYEREVDLLFAQSTREHLVYFSSLAVFYGHNRYVRHKNWMEQQVIEHFPRYTIIRIGNITWGKNPHTLINYLKAHPDADILDEWRYIVDEDEFLHWINLIPEWSCEINIPGQRMKVKDIWSKYVKN